MAQTARGEIWWFGFPKPDKRRPVLILTRTEVIEHLRTVTVAPITSTIRGLPSEIVIGPEARLKGTSAIDVDYLATVPKDGLRRFLGSISANTLERGCRGIEFALGCEAKHARRH